MQQEKEELRMQYENLLKENNFYREAARGLNILKNARYNLWMEIKDLVVKEWDQLVDY